MYSSKGNRIAGAVLMSVVVASLAACSKQDTPEQLIAQARQFEQQGDSKAAVIQLKNALAAAPSNATARSALGRVYLDTGDGASAEKELRRALELGADRAQLLPSLAKALLLQGQFQKVLDETADPLLKAGPALLATRGMASLELGKAEQARSLFEAAVQGEPSQPEALMGLARLALQQRDNAAAARHIALASAQHPKNVQLWLFKAQMEQAQGKPDEAQASLDKLLALKPEHADAHLAKAALYIESKKFDAAKAEIAAARKASPDYLMNHQAQALLDFTQGRYAAAKDGLQKILAVAPDYMPAVVMAGAAEFALGSMPQAELHLKKAVDNVPGDLYARKMLASVYLKTGRAREALTLLDPVLAGSTDPQLLKIAGRSHIELREFAPAAAYLERASKLAPEVAELHTALGVSKLGLGDNVAGLAQMETATKLDGGSIESGVALASAQVNLKQYDKALATVQGLQQKYPQEAMLHNLEGSIYLMQNQVAPARASLARAVQLRPDYYAAIASLVQIDLRDKKPEAAKARLAAYLEQHKDSVEAMGAMAGLAQAQGQPAEVTKWLERALAAQPKSADPAIRLLTHYLAIKEPAKALTLARNTQVAFPDKPELLELLAQAQLATQDRAGALESYSKLAALMPANPTVQYRLAAYYIAAGNRAAAADSLKKALTLRPAYPEAQLALADLERRKGNYAYGLDLARQLQAKKGSRAAGYMLEGDMEMARGKPDAAAKAFASALELNKEAPMLLKLAEALKRGGKAQEAQERLQAWSKAHPSDVLVGLALSENHLAAKQYAPAVDELLRLQKLAPDSAAVVNNLAWVYYSTGDARALATAEQAHRLAGNSPAVLDTLGWILVERGQAARGVDLLQKAVAADPDAVEIRYHLAAALLKANDKAGARQQLERVLAGAGKFSKREEARALLNTL